MSTRETMGRLLFAWSDPKDRVPAAQHREVLVGAAEAGQLEFIASQGPQGDVLARMSLDALKKKLKGAADAGRPYRVLHLLAHGGAVPGGTDAGLVLFGDSGDPITAAPDRVAGVIGAFADSLRLVVVCACHGGDFGAPGSAMGSVARVLHQEGIERVIASRFEWSVSGSVEFAREFYRTLLARPSSVEVAMAAARDALLSADALDAASLQLYARRRDGWDSRPFTLRPYRGLATYKGADRRFYFGRSNELERLVQRVEGARRGGTTPQGWPAGFQIVEGASGSGKSSLIQAGLIPSLCKPKGDWKVETPGVTGLATFVAPAERPLLVVADQLEQLFTLEPDAATRDAAARRLWTLAQEPDVVVLAGIRSDYKHRLGELQVTDEGLTLDRPAYHPDHYFFVPRLSPEELEDVIRRPAERVGVTLEAGLVDLIKAQAGSKGGAGVLPLVNMVLDELWKRRVEPCDEGGPPRRMTIDALVRELEGVEGVLKARVKELTDALDAAQKAALQRAVVQLVAYDPGSGAFMRTRVPLAELGALAENGLLDRLVAAQLVVSGRDKEHREPWVELAHDAILLAWSDLQAWVVAAQETVNRRRDLLRRARAWSQRKGAPGEDETILLTPRELREARRLVPLADRSREVDQLFRDSGDSRRHVLDDLEEEGWGLVLPEGRRGDELLEAVQPLVAYRAEQMGREPRIFRAPSITDREVISAWWRENYFKGVTSSEERPRYLMLLGELSDVSIEIQYELQSELRVGRLCSDTPEDMRRYAEKVRRLENAPAKPSRRVVLVRPMESNTTTNRLGQIERAICDGLRNGVDSPYFDVVEYGPAFGIDMSTTPSKDDLQGELVMYFGQGHEHPGQTLDEQHSRQGALFLGRVAPPTANAQPGALFYEASTVPAPPCHPGSIWFAMSNLSAGTTGSPPAVISSTIGPSRFSNILRHRWEWAAPVDGKGFIAALPRKLLSEPEAPVGFLGLTSLGWSAAWEVAAPKAGDDTATGVASGTGAYLQPFVDAMRTILLGGRFGAAVSILHREARVVAGHLWHLVLTRRLTESSDDSSASLETGETKEQMFLAELRRLRESADNSTAISESEATREQMFFAELRRQTFESLILLGDPAAHLPPLGPPPSAPAKGGGA